MDLKKAKHSKRFSDQTVRPDPWHDKAWIDASVQTQDFNDRVEKTVTKRRLKKQLDYAATRGTGERLKIDRRANKYKKAY